MSELISQQILRFEFEQRKRRNALYSLRAFARDLGMSRTTVTDVMAGKRKMSKSNLLKIASRLKIEESELAKLQDERKRTWSQLRDDLNRRTLDEAEFGQICSWQHYAILNLAKLHDNRATPRWVSERLGIDIEEAKQFLRVLRELNLVTVEDGKLKRVTAPLQTSRDIPSRLIRDQHRQFLELAEQSLDHVDVELRDIATITVAIDSKRIPAAKKLLLDARRKIAALLESDTPDTVYTIGTTLFPTRQHRMNL